MDKIWEGIIKAIELIVTLDPETIEIAGRSLLIATSSCTIATLIFLPIGSVIHFNNFWGKRALINVIQTLYSVPTVAIGLLVYLFIRNYGPFGAFNLMFTPGGIVIAQVILIAPIITGLTISALSSVDKLVTETAVSLGANRFQTVILVLKEVRFAILAGVIMGFGRAISEVGISLIIGGNIRGYTRTMTTAISLESGKGDLPLSIALAIILVSLALIINIIMNLIQHRKE